VKSIDFLPTGYRQRRANRGRNRVRIAVISVLIAGLAGLHGAQRTWLAVERSATAETTRRLAEAELTRTRHQMLLKQSQDSAENLELIVFLNHPWPTTRILHTLATRVPSTLSFNELRIVRDANNPPAPTGDAAAPPVQSGLASIDVKQLRTTYDTAKAKVTLRGQTESRGDLYDYVARLESDSIVEHPRLVSLIVSPVTSGEREWDYVIEASIRSGYGQLGFSPEQSRPVSPTAVNAELDSNLPTPSDTKGTRS
jgi:hypothetical protein